MTRQFLSVNEVAEIIGVAPGTVRRWIRDRELLSVRIGKPVRVPVAEIDRLRQDAA